MLKRLPDGARAEMVSLLHAVGDDELARMQRTVLVRTGFLRSGLAKRVYDRSLRLRVGFLTRKSNADRFYRWIIERGRKAQTVKVTRRKGVAQPVTYMLRVRALRENAFVFAGGGAARAARSDRMKRYWDDVLGRVSIGADVG
ncbi:hypothetical protein SAMN06295912_108120 [Sphingomonas laterariae]|uniref:Uncharacterized protein n=1 Tax=Edaphosphingomonas laterariae TaxID=861865 RepID=A0A239F8X2_9SPHN|nr:hypothetical protein [Sphingomonas laterariae]SNS53247.1 hypothetical protein SAMN06295912_108120 [Sphingomonas laterariae]